MTRSTHQIAAFTAAVCVLALARPIVVSSLPDPALPAPVVTAAHLLRLDEPGGHLPWAAAPLYAVIALLGGLVPDLDQIKRKGGRLPIAKALGGHRHLSHSFLGAGLAAALAYGVAALVAALLSLPAGVLWLAFLAGYLSHLALDALTYEGIPLLFPVRRRFGVPPLAALRVRTGSWVEHFVVMPGLLTLLGWLAYSQGSVLLSLWR